MMNMMTCLKSPFQTIPNWKCTCAAHLFGEVTKKRVFEGIHPAGPAEGPPGPTVFSHRCRSLHQRHPSLAMGLVLPRELGLLS